MPTPRPTNAFADSLKRIAGALSRFKKRSTQVSAISRAPVSVLDIASQFGQLTRTTNHFVHDIRKTSDEMQDTLIDQVRKAMDQHDVMMFPNLCKRMDTPAHGTFDSPRRAMQWLCEVNDFRPEKAQYTGEYTCINGVITVRPIQLIANKDWELFQHIAMKATLPVMGQYCP